MGEYIELNLIDINRLDEYLNDEFGDIFVQTTINRFKRNAEAIAKRIDLMTRQEQEGWQEEKVLVPKGVLEGIAEHSAKCRVYINKPIDGDMERSLIIVNDILKLIYRVCSGY